LSTIVATPWVKHEGLGFDGRMENTMNIKTIFLKDKYMPDSAYSLGEGETTISEVSNLLPPRKFCGILKEGSDENISQT